MYYKRIDTAIILFFTIVLLMVSNNSAQVAKQNPSELQKIDVEEHLGDIIPLDLQFTDDHGKTVLLGDYFNKNKPVILVLAYYECPMLCTLVLNGVTQSIDKLNMKLGKDYQILTVSIDPKETTDLAAAKKQTYLKMLHQPVDSSGWIFMTGKQENIKKLADAIGFKYYYVKDRDEFAHPTIITLISDKGKISRYLYGIEYKTNDLKLGLLEAAEGKVGTTLDRIILYCYHYDPDANGYVVFATNVMKVGGVITLVVLFGFFGFLWIKDSHKKSGQDNLDNTNT